MKKESGVFTKVRILTEDGELFYDNVVRVHMDNTVSMFENVMVLELESGDTLEFVETEILVLCQDLVQVKMRNFSPF